MPISKLTSLPFPPPPTPPFSASGQGLVASVNQLIDTSAASLKSLPSNPQTDTVYGVIGFYAGSTKGGGRLVWQSSASKSLHNGVTHYAPEAIAAWDGTQAGLPTLLNWTGTGSGCWVRSDLQGFVTPEMAGAAVGFDSASAQQAAINYLGSAGGGGELRLGSYYESSGVSILHDNIIVRGLGGTQDSVGATHVKYIGSPVGTNSVGAFCFGQPKSGSGSLVGVKGCKLIGMTIDGNRSGGAIGSAVRVATFDGFLLEDIHTYDCAQSYGFALVGTGSNPRKNIHVKNCSALRCGADGLDIKAGAEHILIDGFVSKDHLDETGGDSVGIDIRGQYVTINNPVTSGCPEIGIRVRINAGENDSVDWTVTKNARVNINSPISYGNRDNYDISSPANSVVNITNITSRLATRYGVATSGSGIVNITNGSSTECLIGVFPSASGDFRAANFTVDRNTQDGVAGLNCKKITFIGGSINSNSRYGIQQTDTTADAEWRFSGTDIQGNLTNYAVTSASANGLVEFINTSNKLATSRGVQITASPATIKFFGGAISGNVTNVHSVNDQTTFDGVSGVKTSARGSAVASVASVGLKSATVTHGLAYSPSPQDIQVSLGRNTVVSDYEIAWVRVSGTSSTQITFELMVKAASATGGAEVNVLWQAKVRQAV